MQSSPINLFSFIIDSVVEHFIGGGYSSCSWSIIVYNPTYFLEYLLTVGTLPENKIDTFFIKDYTVKWMKTFKKKQSAPFSLAFSTLWILKK